MRAEHRRYLAGGAICALLNNVILIGGDRLGVGYAALTGLAFLVTGTLAYFVHSRFTFRRTGLWGSYAMFMTGIALGLPLWWKRRAVRRSAAGPAPRGSASYADPARSPD